MKYASKSVDLISHQGSTMRITSVNAKTSWTRTLQEGREISQVTLVPVHVQPRPPPCQRLAFTRLHTQTHKHYCTASEQKPDTLAGTGSVTLKGAS